MKTESALHKKFILQDLQNDYMNFLACMNLCVLKGKGRLILSDSARNAEILSEGNKGFETEDFRRSGNFCRPVGERPAPSFLFTCVCCSSSWWKGN